MNTILKIARRAALPHRPTTAALALPHRVPFFEIPISISAAVRHRVSTAAIIVAVSAAIAYVVAVNVMLVAGQAIKNNSRTLSTLSQERSALASALVSRESPQRLEAEARVQGMVEAIGVRFLAGSDTVALSR